MAWSDAARRASAMIRRRMAEAKGRFHEHGTPEFNAFYTTPAHRAGMAGRLKDLRKRSRAGASYSMSHEDRETINAVAYTSRMRTHWAAPKRSPKLFSNLKDRNAPGRKKYSRLRRAGRNS